MRAASREAPDDALERFRAIGIAYVQFAVEHPEHFRAMSAPGCSSGCRATEQPAQRERRERTRARLARAQAAGEIAAIPLDDLMLAATSLIHGDREA